MRGGGDPRHEGECLSGKDMIFATGFLIAVVIGITGVGGGTITVPVLLLFLHLDASKSIGTALAFTAAVKLLVAPVYLYRRQISFPALGLMLAGGLPGLFIGLHFLENMRRGALMLPIGILIVVTALLTLIRAARQNPGPRHERLGWLPWVMLPIGAEIGFSSAGAGAVGSLALLSLTRLSVAEVAGSNIVFVLVLSLIGGGVLIGHHIYEPVVLTQLIIGGLLGAFVGPYVGSLVPPKLLRVALCLWLTFLGTVLCWR
jgi:uncharacterized membrane protein YfcA